MAEILCDRSSSSLSGNLMTLCWLRTSYKNTTALFPHHIFHPLSHDYKLYELIRTIVLHYAGAIIPLQSYSQSSADGLHFQSLFVAFCTKWKAGLCWDSICFSLCGLDTTMQTLVIAIPFVILKPCLWPLYKIPNNCRPIRIIEPGEHVLLQSS